MKKDIDVRLTFGSWVYLAGLVGLSGGFVVALISAIWSAVHGEWLEAIVVLVTGPISGLLCFALYAALGYFVYVRIAATFPGSRRLSGVFMELSPNDAQELTALKVDARNARALNAAVM